MIPPKRCNLVASIILVASALTCSCEAWGGDVVENGLNIYRLEGLLKTFLFPLRSPDSAPHPHSLNAENDPDTSIPARNENVAILIKDSHLMKAKDSADNVHWRPMRHAVKKSGSGELKKLIVEGILNENQDEDQGDELEGPGQMDQGSEGEQSTKMPTGEPKFLSVGSTTMTSNNARMSEADDAHADMTTVESESLDASTIAVEKIQKITPKIAINRTPIDASIGQAEDAHGVTTGKPTSLEASTTAGVKVQEVTPKATMKATLHNASLGEAKDARGVTKEKLASIGQAEDAHGVTTGKPTSLEASTTAVEKVQEITPKALMNATLYNASMGEAKDAHGGTTSLPAVEKVQEITPKSVINPIPQVKGDAAGAATPLSPTYSNFLIVFIPFVIKICGM